MNNYKFKSAQRCGTNACVLVDNTSLPDKILVSDQANNICEYTYDEWRVFIDAVKRGEFDI